MKTFKQHITELWDKPLPYKLVNREKHPRFPDQGWLYEYKFKIKSTPFDVTFSNQLENDPPYWDVSFVDDEGNVSDVTGTAGTAAVKVFSTVYAIIQDWIKKENPTIFMFGADKSESLSRSKLYDRMVRSLKPNGYTLKVVKSGSMNRYWFRKK